MEGKVIFFSAKKGWGFISQGDGKPDLFTHWSSIRGMSGYKELKAEQLVSFDIGKGPTGREQAENVFVLEEK